MHEDDTEPAEAGASSIAHRRTRDMNGDKLVPGVNVDPVDIAAGVREARNVGYGDQIGLMVAQYALQRHARGEEEGAISTWTHQYPGDLASWYRILAAAVAAGTAALNSPHPAPTTTQKEDPL